MSPCFVSLDKVKRVLLIELLLPEPSIIFWLHNSTFPQLCDFPVIDAELVQDLVAMLAEQWRRILVLQARIGESKRTDDLRHHTTTWMRQVAQHFPLFDLRVIEHFRDRVDRTAWHPGRRQMLDPITAVFEGECLIDFG